MSIVKNLVEMHGGTVQANSRGEGQGATFIFHLPLHALESSEGEESAPHPRMSLSDLSVGFERPNLRGVKVLVAKPVESAELLAVIAGLAGRSERTAQE